MQSWRWHRIQDGIGFLIKCNHLWLSSSAINFMYWVLSIPIPCSKILLHAGTYVKLPVLWPLTQNGRQPWPWVFAGMLVCWKKYEKYLGVWGLIRDRTMLEVHLSPLHHPCPLWKQHQQNHIKAHTAFSSLNFNISRSSWRFIFFSFFKVLITFYLGHNLTSIFLIHKVIHLIFYYKKQNYY